MWDCVLFSLFKKKKGLDSLFRFKCEIVQKKVRPPVLTHCHLRVVISRRAVFMSHGSRIPLVYKLHESCGRLFSLLLPAQNTSLSGYTNPVCPRANP